MIVSLRGPSGAGKSHVVHAIIRECEVVKMQYPGRKRPIGLLLRPPASPTATIFVPGHYDIANGGIDTLSSLDVAYELIRQHAELGLHVLCEGKCMSDGYGRLCALAKSGQDVRVLFLDTPVNECLASIRARGHRIAKKSVERVYEKCRRDRSVLMTNKFVRETWLVDRPTAMLKVKEWLI